MTRTNWVTALPALLFLGIWQMSSANPRLRFVVGDPWSVAAILFNETLTGALPRAALITGTEALLGFLLGCFFGTIVGFLLWYSPTVSRISRPYLLALSSVPIFAFAPIIIVWFGIGFQMKVSVAFLGTFLTALDQSFHGASSLDPADEQFFTALGATRMKLLMKVVIPRSITWVLSSMRLNIGVALLGAFVGEFISADDGLGYFMVRHGSLYDVPSVFAGAVYFSLLAYLFHAALGVLERNRLAIAAITSIPASTRKFRGNRSRNPMP